MPFIARKQIKPEIKKPYDDAYRERLKQMLLTPGLTDDQKRSIRRELDEVKSRP